MAEEEKVMEIVGKIKGVFDKANRTVLQLENGEFYTIWANVKDKYAPGQTVHLKYLEVPRVGGGTWKNVLIRDGIPQITVVQEIPPKSEEKKPEEKRPMLVELPTTSEGEKEPSNRLEIARMSALKVAAEIIAKPATPEQVIAIAKRLLEFIRSPET